MMTCDCYENMEKNLVEVSGDKNARIEKGFVLIASRMETVPLVPAFFKEKKKDGSLKVHPSKQNLLANYCPFCGKKAVGE
jgi:hypothetical protein